MKAVEIPANVVEAYDKARREVAAAGGPTAASDAAWATFSCAHAAVLRSLVDGIDAQTGNQVPFPFPIRIPAEK